MDATELLGDLRKVKALVLCLEEIADTIARTPSGTGIPAQPLEWFHKLIGQAVARLNRLDGEIDGFQHLICDELTDRIDEKIPGVERSIAQLRFAETMGAAAKAARALSAQEMAGGATTEVVEAVELIATALEIASASARTLVPGAEQRPDMVS
jgi:hypothetical protein